MILGMSLSTFTLVHVLISLAGIGSGLVVVYGMLTRNRMDGPTAFFLATTILTDLTGYLFPVEHILPSHIVGAISLAALAIALVARYGRRMEGSWRWIYVVTAMIGLYLNVFVAVIQSFLKIPAVHALAPTQKEAPFLVVQLLVMAIFVVLGVFVVKKFQIALAATAPAAWKKAS
jgi:uncharacterized membrane protein SirB2